MDAAASPTAGHTSAESRSHPAHDRRVVVTADVGGTFVKSGIVGPAGVRGVRREPTERQRGSAAVTADLVARLATHLDEARRDGLEPIAAGLAVTGVVDEANGIVGQSAAFDWEAFAIGDHIAAALGVPVTVSHDVRAGGRAEARFGAAAGHASSVFVALGTGIAAAICIDGQIIAGPTFQAGEIGQHPVADPDDPRSRRPLEAVASASAITRRYRAHTGVDTADAARAAAAVATGDDPIAAAIWHDATSALAEALALTVAALDPTVVVLGGGLAAAGTTLTEPIAAGLAERLPWRSAPPVVTARFGPAAGFVGTALAAWTATTGESESLRALLGDSWETLHVAGLMPPLPGRPGHSRDDQRVLP